MALLGLWIMYPVEKTKGLTNIGPSRYFTEIHFPVERALHEEDTRASGGLAATKSTKDVIKELGILSKCLVNNSYVVRIITQETLLAGGNRQIVFTITMGNPNDAERSITFVLRVWFRVDKGKITKAYLVVSSPYFKIMYRPGPLLWLEHNLEIVVSYTNGTVFEFNFMARYVGEDQDISLLLTPRATGPKTIKSEKVEQTRALEIDNCPRIAAYSVTDPVIAGNVSMVVLRSMSAEGFQAYIRRPKFTSIAAPAECMTLIEKSLVFMYDLDIFMEYACVRYFLWFLTTGKWCVKILLRRYTNTFLRKLSQGKYACWRDYFLQDKFKGYESYFLY